MSRQVHITILVENTTQGRMLLGEHGLSFWIETDARHVLFDTGQGAVLAGNAHKLGARLELTNAIVLSHGHYDHSGGLGTALRAAGPARVYAHPAAFQPKFARRFNGRARDVGILFVNEDSVRRHAEDLIWTEEPMPIGGDLYLTGPIPRRNDYEDTGGRFFVDKDCQTPDTLIDDQALYFDTAHGTVVLLGCAHAGIINTLHYIRQLTGQRPIHAVMGGMHLGTASETRIEKTIAELRALGVERLAPAHCTGIAAIARLWSAFPDRCIPCMVGTEIVFDS